MTPRVIPHVGPMDPTKLGLERLSERTSPKEKDLLHPQGDTHGKGSGEIDHLLGPKK